VQKREEDVPEKSIFEGTPPIIRGTADIIIYGGISLTGVGLLISLPWLLARYLKSKSNYFKITNKKIRYEHGLLSTNIDTMRLYRIKDVQYSKSLGRERISLISQDETTPTLQIPVSDGQGIFNELEETIEESRRRANVSMKENV
jgi:uncharacterized membrane protein YdbT with pleckstrin-like domain